MKKLIKGLHTFQTTIFPKKKGIFQDLIKGQKPEVLFITCSDSRINPNLVTSADPGELFIIRNAGNIIPDYKKGGGEWATIEFAIHALQVGHIIVCGHSHCGAIEAALHKKSMRSTPLLKSWIHENIDPTLQLIEDNYEQLTERSKINILTQENVLHQIENLKMNPAINKKLEDGSLTIHAWIYEFETGEIFSFNATKGQFEPIVKSSN